MSIIEAKKAHGLAAFAAFGAIGVLVLSANADWSFNIPTSYPYNVKPSEIVPVWNGTNPGEWSFNYEGVMEKAKSEGKYTLLLFTAMWWCPHCQSLEANVLSKPGFAQYVAEQGYYLAAVDFPYRDGHSNWCWLWDPAYRAANGIGDWSEEQVADEIAKRFEFQGLMYTQNAATTTNNNVLVQISADGSTTNLAVYAANPTTVYRRVGYPTIIVIDPEGKEAGRFSYSLRQGQETGLDYVIDNIEVIKAAGKSDLFEKPEAGGLVGETAQTYNAVLTSAAGSPVGTAVFKTAKKNARLKTIAVSATIQISGGKKVMLKGTAEGSEGEIIHLSKAGSTASATVKIGTDGVVGAYTDGAANYNVQGSRNAFRARDAAGKARAATLAKGVWPVVFKTADNGGSAFANGCSGFSATVGLNGKTKVAGTLGDGTKVSLLAQAIVGENGRVLVPVMDKKGAYSFMLKFQGGLLVEVTGVSSWKSSSRQAQFTATWEKPAVFSAAAGSGAVSDVMYLQIGGFDPAAGIGGKALAVSPADDAIIKKGNRWTGTKGVSDLMVTFKPQAGTFRGSFNFYVNDGAPKPKKLKATVSGVVVDGVPQGTAVIKGVGSLPVKFAGSCGGGC